jgi:hypothetical protein
MLQNNLTYRSEEGMQSLTDTPRQTLHGLRGGKAGRTFYAQGILKIVIIF